MNAPIDTEISVHADPAPDPAPNFEVRGFWITTAELAGDLTALYDGDTLYLRPTTHHDVTKRHEAIAKWLAAQIVLVGFEGYGFEDIGPLVWSNEQAPDEGLWLGDVFEAAKKIGVASLFAKRLQAPLVDQTVAG